MHPLLDLRGLAFVRQLTLGGHGCGRDIENCRYEGHNGCEYRQK